MAEKEKKKEGLSKQQKWGLGLQALGATLEDVSSHLRGEKTQGRVKDFGIRLDEAMERLKEDAEEAAEIAQENRTFEAFVGGKGSEGILHPDIQKDASKWAEIVRKDDSYTNKLEAFTEGLKRINLVDKTVKELEPAHPLDKTVKWKRDEYRSKMFDSYVQKIADESLEKIGAVPKKRTFLDKITRWDAESIQASSDAKLRKTIRNLEHPGLFKKAVEKKLGKDSYSTYIKSALDFEEDEFQTWAQEKYPTTFRQAFPLSGGLK